LSRKGHIKRYASQQALITARVSQERVLAQVTLKLVSAVLHRHLPYQQNWFIGDVLLRGGPPSSHQVPCATPKGTSSAESGCCSREQEQHVTNRRTHTYSRGSLYKMVIKPRALLPRLAFREEPRQGSKTLQPYW